MTQWHNIGGKRVKLGCLDQQHTSREGVCGWAPGIYTKKRPASSNSYIGGRRCKKNSNVAHTRIIHWWRRNYRNSERKQLTSHRCSGVDNSRQLASRTNKVSLLPRWISADNDGDIVFLIAYPGPLLSGRHSPRSPIIGYRSLSQTTGPSSSVDRSFFRAMALLSLRVTSFAATDRPIRINGTISFFYALKRNATQI